jgi:hypothetical protein
MPEWRPKHDTMAIFSCRVVPKHDGAGRRARVVPGTMASLRCRAVNPARGVWEGNLRRRAAASSAIGRGTSASKLQQVSHGSAASADGPPRIRRREGDLRRRAAANPSRGGRVDDLHRRAASSSAGEGQSGRRWWCWREGYWGGGERRRRRKCGGVAAGSRRRDHRTRRGAGEVVAARGRWEGGENF